MILSSINFRKKITNYVLDLVEKLPDRNNGKIGFLQGRRKHQREIANTSYERSELPIGDEFDYLGFTLIAQV